MVTKSKLYNIYCDESCHLENDNQNVMLFGAIWCPKQRIHSLSTSIRTLKNKYNACGELKWIKVSKSREKFYLELVNEFFQEPDLHFRCLVVNNKSKLNHEYFNKGSHDTFYYKMYYSMLKTILNPINKYNIYLDIKDTRSKYKVYKLKEVLCNNVFDFTQQMIENIQQIRSHESELMQLADFLIGAVSYKNRNLNDNQTKVSIINLIESKTKQNLSSSSSLINEKFNLFIFTPQEII